MLAAVRASMPRPASSATSVAAAAGERAQTLTRSIGRTARCASASRRATRPAPISARWRASFGASHDAASADVAAVRRAVISSPSIAASGTPVVAS